MILRRLLAASLSGLLAFGTAQAQTRARPQADSHAMPPPGYQPDLSTDEAGMWMQVDKLEADIKSSPTRIRDEKLNAYVQGLVCKLSGEYCRSIRVYVMEVPAFNASMLPNGTMVVWSGLLLRAENEAQVAFVLGHEITHYLHRHSLERFRRVIRTTGFMAVFGMMTAAAGVGLVGLAANAAAVGSLYANSREQERDADSGGFATASAMGYDPYQAPAVWRFVAAESNANPRNEHAVFFATHPEPQERLTAMQEQAKTEAARRSDWTTNMDPFHAVVEPFLDRWVADELARGEAEESSVLFERLTFNQPGRGLFRYALGESYRKRNAPGDIERARAAYRAALDCADAPPQAWRGLGLSAMREGDKAAAKEAFTQYRAKAPDADDKAMIDFYLTQL